MGQNFVAILAHHLPLDDSLLTVLPEMLAPTRSPGLAIAIQHLVAVENARSVDLARTYPSERPAAPMMADEQWVVKEPRPLSVADYLAEYGWIDLDGPENVHLHIHRRSLTVSSAARWGAFLIDPPLRVAIRRVCHKLARIFGSPSALYVSDYWEPIDALCEGATMEEAIAAIEKRLGPPATTIESIYQKKENGTWSGDGYFIDTFADLDDAE